jgi:coenzyme F420-dependent glucose-6-phosphate dehydrogenase
VVAASGPESASLAAAHGDGLIVTSAEPKVLEAFRADDGDGPLYGQVTACWATSADEARKTAHTVWRTAGVPGDLSQELALPRHFEQASSLVTPESMAEHMPMGPDPSPYVDAVREYIDAGVENVYLHQIGPDQEGFFRFFREELAPELERIGSRSHEPAAIG